MTTKLYKTLISSIGNTVYKSINEAYNVDEIQSSALNGTLYNYINTENGIIVKLINIQLGSIMPSDCITLKIGLEYKYSELAKQMNELKLNRDYNALFFHIVSKICDSVRFRDSKNIWWGDSRHKQNIKISKLDVKCTDVKYTKKPLYHQLEISDFSFIINELKINEPSNFAFIGTGTALSYKGDDPLDIDCIITLAPDYCRKQESKFVDRLEKNNFKDPLLYKRGKRDEYINAYKGENFGDKEFGKRDKTSGLYKSIVNDMISAYKYGMDNIKKLSKYSSNKPYVWSEDVVRDFIIKETKYHKNDMDGSFYRWFKAKYPEFYNEMEQMGVIAQIK